MGSPFEPNSDPRDQGEGVTAARPVRSRSSGASVAVALLLSMVVLGCEDRVDVAPSDPDAADRAPRVDPDALRVRLGEIRRAGDDIERLEALASLLREVDETAEPILRSETTGRASTWRPFDRLVLLAAWARLAGEEATRWSAHAAPKSYRAVALELAMASWARTDSQAALAGFLGNHASDSAAIAGLVAGWLEADPVGLEAFIEELDLSSETGQHAVAVYVRRRIEREGTAAATVWAEDRGASWQARRARHLYRQVASELTMADPAAGVAFCERHCDGASGGGVRQMVATRWSHQDPVATLEWLLASNDADPAERKFAVNVAYANWLRSAPREAIDWAVAQEPALRDETWFEPVVRRVARSLGWKRAEEALVWAESISRAAERERAQVFVLRRWRARDEVGAEAWMAASSLSVALKEEVRSPSREATGE